MAPAFTFDEVAGEAPHVHNPSIGDNGWWLARRVGPAMQPPLIAVLEGASAATMADRYDAFRAGLRQPGYVEGINIRFDCRYADGFLDRLPALAAELVLLQPRVIVSAPMPANLAASKATSTIPIVMANGADPGGVGDRSN